MWRESVFIQEHDITLVRIVLSLHKLTRGFQSLAIIRTHIKINDSMFVNMVLYHLNLFIYLFIMKVI